MKLYFGTALDNRAYPHSTSTTKGSLIAGPTKLLTFLEQICLSPYHETTEAYAHIRLEYVRKFLALILIEQADSFFKDSFEADPYGTAKKLLELRDELLLAGYNFEASMEHNRLHVFHHLEQAIKKLQSEWPKGFADRFDFVRNRIDSVQVPLTEIVLAEPIDLLPGHFKRLIEKILESNPDIILTQVSQSGKASDKSSDLAIVQDLFINNKMNLSLKGDSSFQIWNFNTEADASQHFAQILDQKERLFFIPDQSSALDQSISNYGYPSMGIPTSAPVRPGLMLLKSISVFLWGPLDLFKVIDFLKLPASPFDKGLARELIKEFSDAPGFDQQKFEIVVNNYLRKKDHYSAERVQKLIEEYQFWFHRDKYDATIGCPKNEILSIYKHLSKHLSAKDLENQHLSLLNKLCRQLLDLLDSYEIETISQLQLEQIINSIFQAAPFQLNERMVNAPNYVSKATAILEPCKQIIWWNCNQGSEQYQFSTWSNKELSFLNELGCYPDLPSLETKQKIWRRLWPILQAEEKLILIVPKKIKGEAKEASNIIMDLEERLSNLYEVQFNIRVDSIREGFNQAALKTVAPIRKVVNTGFTHVNQLDKLLKDFDEHAKWSYSSLNKLFYHPYQFAFSYLLKLRRSSIQSIKNENRIKGVVGHDVFEHLFQMQDVLNMPDAEFESNFEERYNDALSRKGVIFLLYGKESERQSLKKSLLEAAKIFRKKIKENGWQIMDDSCEKVVKGTVLSSLNFRGIMDMVLYRGDEILILDLKWQQSNKKTDEIRSKEDLQLILYSLVEKGISGKKIHTAYFLFKIATFIARNEEALQGISVVKNNEGSFADEDAVRDEVEAKMLATFNWRTDQLKHGKLEMYLESTKAKVNYYYSETNGYPSTVLELKEPFEKYDDYKNLLGLFS